LQQLSTELLLLRKNAKIVLVNTLFLQDFVKNCGSDLSGLSGTIQSPNYPKPYGNNAYCEWTIASPPNKRINITITAFNTEANFDRLFILRSGNCSQVKTYFSGSSPEVVTPQTIAVGQNTASVYFYSDSSVVSNGFSLSWTAA
jgi:cubilin